MPREYYGPFATMIGTNSWAGYFYYIEDGKKTTIKVTPPYAYYLTESDALKNAKIRMDQHKADYEASLKAKEVKDQKEIDPSRFIDWSIQETDYDAFRFIIKEEKVEEWRLSWPFYVDQPSSLWIPSVNWQINQPYQEVKFVEWKPLPSPYDLWLEEYLKEVKTQLKAEIMEEFEQKEEEKKSSGLIERIKQLFGF